MFQRILVAVDGTITSTGALEVATSLANDAKGTLHVLHVVDERIIPRRYAEGAHLHPHYINGALDRLRAKGRRILALAQKSASAKGAKVDPILISESNPDVASVVLREAGELAADLIVLGTHGRRGLTRLLMGSDAEAVLRQARVPVLLVRAPTDARASRKGVTSKRSKAQPSKEEEAVRPSGVSTAS